MITTQNERVVTFLKKVTLLGDSIRLIGYGLKTPEYLGDGYTVFQPKDNCRFASYLLRMVFDCRREIESSDAVHFHCGSWDACDLFADGAFTPLPEYLQTTLRIADLLGKMCPKVIFATTTPVLDGGTDQRNDLIVRQNEAVVPLLLERGVVINDLYSTVQSDITRIIRADDRVHLTDYGIDVLARQTAEIIKREMGA